LASDNPNERALPPDQTSSAGYALAPGPWLEVLRAVVASVEASDVRELEVRAYGLRIALRRVEHAFSAPSVAAPSFGGSSEETSQLHPIRTPLTGIWYDAPSPSTPPFVRAGDVVETGTVVGLVETMKVFNEVTSDATGIVREVLCRRGDLVTAQSAVLLVELTDVMSAAQVPIT
jgi:acetyl-CoA carboxylase biotin carboxyl carrier protein